MRLLKRFAMGLIAAGERAGRRKAHEVLRAMPSQQQLELGYSPALVRQGVEAWPWKEEARGNGTKRVLAPNSLRPTGAGLTVFSDANLVKLGFDGGDDPHATRHGLEGGIDEAA
jgi:hypothetical protein